MSKQRLIIREERELVVIQAGVKMLLSTEVNARDAMAAIKVWQKVKRYFEKQGR
jgi:hypothetical protein